MWNSTISQSFPIWSSKRNPKASKTHQQIPWTSGRNPWYVHDFPMILLWSCHFQSLQKQLPPPWAIWHSGHPSPGSWPIFVTTWEIYSRTRWDHPWNSTVSVFSSEGTLYIYIYTYIYIYICIHKIYTYINIIYVYYIYIYIYYFYIYTVPIFDCLQKKSWLVNVDNSIDTN